MDDKRWSIKGGRALNNKNAAVKATSISVLVLVVECSSYPFFRYAFTTRTKKDGRTKQWLGPEGKVRVTARPFPWQGRNTQQLDKHPAVIF